MVELDVGEHGHRRQADVGGVPASAEPHLEHRHVHPAAHHLEQRHHRHELEVREPHRRRPLDGAADPRDAVRQRRPADGGAVHPDALAHVDEMRRSIEADREAAALQRRRDQRRDRALPVGAAHPHDP
ncbi:MAG: hypothetical protein U0610_09440 [bacterium]